LWTREKKPGSAGYKPAAGYNPAPQRISPFLISFAVTSIFFFNFCNLIFGCGCRALWAGADAACNIHAMHGRHCPWCSHGYAGYAIVMTLITGPQLAIALLTRWSWLQRTAACLALFPLAGGAVAVLFGWLDKYWSA
jgi:hypothetical protein